MQHRRSTGVAIGPQQNRVPVPVPLAGVDKAVPARGREGRRFVWRHLSWLPVASEPMRMACTLRHNGVWGCRCTARAPRPHRGNDD